ncbi:MAG: ATP-binding cassette domain-containing protein [Bacillota bacterium]
MSFLEVRELRKTYKDVVAVDGAHFYIEKGEVFGLLGPNGAGKSTTISMVAGLLRPSGGSIMLKGKDVTSNPSFVKNVLGLVPQDVALYPTLTASENLYFWGRMYGLGGSLLKERVEQALQYAGLTERAKDRIETYSGGMKRRINIAAALVHRPELLIMDEPTVGIDPQSRNHILETVLSLNKEGITVIYTSHYMEEVEYLCSRVAIMDHGKVIATGTTEELRRLAGDADRLDVAASDITEAVIAELKGIAGVTEVTSQNGTVTVMVKDGHEKVSQVLDVLKRGGARVKSVSILEPNLESVFLRLTGRALRD